MDARGTFHFEGDPITHPRVQRYLRSLLDTTEAGEVVLTLEGKWVYLQLDDLPLRALRCRLGAKDRIDLLLDDARELPLDPGTLWEEGERGLRASVPSRLSSRPLAVRFTNRALMDLQPYIDCEGEADQALLKLGSLSRTIPYRPPTP